jgi:MFS superfamily sulfate permease-like transporter
VDRQDPRRRISPPNRELLAQGVGNLCSGLIGGIPITSVIVRSSANVQAGGQTRLATLTHGTLLLVGVLFMAPLLNRVPLASLAIVLIFVGLKLTAPSLWRQMWRNGLDQFGPFALTVGAIVATDLLTGTLIGFVFGVFVSIRKQQRNAILVETKGDRVDIAFKKDMTFLQKARLKDVLAAIPDDARVTIDRRVADFVDDDIEELLREFCADAPARGVEVEILTVPG